MRKLLKKQGFAPKLLVTDKLRSYGSSFPQLRLTCPHEQGLRKNNRAENSHRLCGDESARCSASNWLDLPSASSACMLRSTTPSTFNANRLAINAADLPIRGGERMAECGGGWVITHPAP